MSTAAGAQPALAPTPGVLTPGVLTPGVLTPEAQTFEEAGLSGAAIGTQAAETAARAGPLVPMIIGSALFMQTLDSTVISNALPSMARALHEDPVALNLAITAYLLAAAVFLPMSAWAADRFGARQVFRLAITGFAGASLLCGLSRTLPELVAARMLQGVAGAMMMPVGRLVILRSTPKSELVRAMSYLTMPAMLGPIIGPPLGGFIVTFSSWRWIFFINVPIGVLGVVLSTLFIPNVRETVRERLDVRGLLLTGLGLAGLVWGFDNLGRSGLPAPLVAALIIGGAAMLGLYALHARGRADPILDLSLLRIPTFAASTLGGLFSRIIIGASPFLMALLLQVSFGLSAFEAGLLTFSGAAGALLMKTTARPILNRFGFRPVLIWNALIVAALSACYGAFTATTPHWLLLATLLIGGFFRSLQFTALNAMAYADIEPARMSRASSLASMFQQLAMSLGVGLAALMLRLVSGLTGAPALSAKVVAPAFVLMAGVSLLGLLFFIALPRHAGAELSGRGASA